MSILINNFNSAGTITISFNLCILFFMYNGRRTIAIWTKHHGSNISNGGGPICLFIREPEISDGGLVYVLPW